MELGQDEGYNQDTRIEISICYNIVNNLGKDKLVICSAGL